MAIELRPIERVFLYNGLALQDALPNQPLEAVQRVHALLYKAITNAVIEGPEYQGDREVYTYKTQVGTKG